MSSQWTNKYAIIRDLSMVQGCAPVDLDGTVAAGQKPPGLNIAEETEEEFFRNCTGGGDFDSPDLGMIKQMLDMVRGLEIGSDEEEVSGATLQITKLNPMSAPFQPKTVQLDTKTSANSNENKQVQPKDRKTEQRKPKLERNVAFTSILKTMALNNQPEVQREPPKKPLELLKPSDFKLPEHMTKSVDKVNGWLDNQEKQTPTLPKNKPALLICDPSSMFKRKKNVTVKKEIENKESTPTKLQNLYKLYVPSADANAYCQKLLERCKVKQMVQEDIWTKAMRQMKEIDAKRKREAELSSATSLCSQHTSTTSTEFDDPKFDPVRLTHHRHLLTEECVVCKVTSKSGVTSPSSSTLDSLRCPMSVETPFNETEESPVCIENGIETV